MKKARTVNRVFVGYHIRIFMKKQINLLQSAGYMDLIISGMITNFVAQNSRLHNIQAKTKVNIHSRLKELKIYSQLSTT